MLFGVSLRPQYTDWDSIRHAAIAVDELGFDWLLTSDHVVASDEHEPDLDGAIFEGWQLVTAGGAAGMPLPSRDQSLFGHAPVSSSIGPLGDHDPAGSGSRDIALRQMIERLAPRERAIVVMHYSHGNGLQEIAERLGLTHTNTRSILFRTRARMRVALSDPAGAATDAA